MSKIYWAIIFKNNWPVKKKKSNPAPRQIYVTKKLRARKEKNVVINQGKEKEQAKAVMQRDWFAQGSNVWFNSKAANTLAWMRL